MDQTVKVFLKKQDSSMEVRRIPLNVVGGGDVNGLFWRLAAKIASIFPSLMYKIFELTWRDQDGDFIVISSDEELIEALTSTDNHILKVYVTETAKQMASEHAPVASETGNNQDISAQLRAVPSAPPHPHIYCPEPYAGGHLYPRIMPESAPPPMDSMQGDHTFGTLSDPAQAVPMMPTPGHVGVVNSQGHEQSSKYQGTEQEKGPGCDKKAWKTGLRDHVPVLHRRWAKDYIRQWRTANVKNATTTTSDVEKEKKLTMEEAGVPVTYSQWLDIVLPRMHKRWGKESPGKFEDGFEKIKAAVPEEFQNWCRWYLKRHFEPKHTPQLKKDKNLKGKNSSTEQENEWKTRKQMKKTVPLEHRIWTKTFVKQWHREYLTGQDSGTSSSESDSDSEAAAREAIPEEVAIPADYPRWLHKFLNRKYNAMGISLRKPDSKVEQGGMEQFKDTVPMDYRKWVKCYVTHQLSGDHKESGQKQGGTAPTDLHRKWMLSFQRKWLDIQFGRNHYPGFHQAEASNPQTSNQVFDMDKLREIIDTCDSEEDNEELSQRQKVPQEFRQWAKDVLNKWDGVTLPAPEEQGTPYNEGSVPPDQDIPPHVLNWMMKVMAKAKMRKVKAQLKAEKQVMKANMKAERLERKEQRKEAKAERREAKQGLRMARKSLKIARRALRFRYV